MCSFRVVEASQSAAMAVLYRVFLSSLLLATHSAASASATTDRTLAFAAPTHGQPPPLSAAAAGLPDLCNLGNASFHLWDAPSTRCKACKGKGSGRLLQPDSKSSAPVKCDGESASPSPETRTRERERERERDRERQIERERETEKR